MKPGETASIVVKTEPKAAVAYLAIYSNNQSGAPKGYGGGYGGNDGGKADDTGTYRSSWKLAANAPPGPARVDVYLVAADGRKGYTNVSFAVAGPSGSC